MSVYLNVRSYSNKQQLLFPSSIGDFLSEDDLVFLIDEVVDSLNLECLYRAISSVGNPSYHPSLMVKILFYGYATKTCSSRKIAARLERDVGFIYLAGMQKPDFRTISDFRKNHLKELKELFRQIVQICYKLGLVRLGHISLDSKVMKANASREESYKLEELIKKETELEKAVSAYLREGIQIDKKEDRRYGMDKRGDELPQKIRQKERRLTKIKEIVGEMRGQSKQEKINLTDPEAKFQKDKGRIIPGYRSQIGVDKEHQVIVVTEVTNEQSDTGQLIPLTDKVIETAKELKGDVEEAIKLTVDSGYSGGDNLVELESRNEDVDVYMPDCLYEGEKRGHLRGKEFDKSQFSYDEVEDKYICPGGQALKRVGGGKEDGKKRRWFYGGAECKECQHFGNCTKSKRGRKIQVSEKEPLIRKMREKLKSADGKEIYSWRKKVVEPVYGNLSENLGFRGFLLRELKKVGGEFSLMCSVHNILKIWRWLKDQKKRLFEALYCRETEKALQLMPLSV